MEGGFVPASRINSRAFCSAIPNPQLSNLHATHDEDDHCNDRPEIPLASTGSSSPNYEGGLSSTNSHASTESRNAREDEYSFVTLPTPSDHKYVVQMPRDQIFRVPPPENADIVKRFRQPLAKKSRVNFKSCLPWLYTFAVAFVILVLALVILQLFLIPQNPEFIVKNLVFRNSTRPEYDISLIAKNPNRNLFTIIFEGAEDATLIYESKGLAEGAFPSFEQGSNDSANVTISFSSLKRNSLPVDLEKNLMGKKKMPPLEFSLEMEMPIRSKLSAIPALRSNKMSVKCYFTVDGLAARTKIVAQKCRTTVH